MNLQNLRWPVMIAATAVTLAVLVGAGFLVKSQTVEEPLRAVYANAAAVENSTIERQGDTYQIKVKFKDVPDFAPAFIQLHAETEKLLKQAPFEIVVEDQRNPKLDQAFRRVNLFVQEALATGQFSAMADRVEAEAAKAGLTARLEVDNHRVFVQMKDGDSYLYSVAERTKAEEKQTRMEGGLGL